ncbi:sterol desaturase [Ceratobasidium sp. AG-I]|nr:sterol desaturase [Ceratobasidium sp. AG-I]
MPGPFQSAWTLVLQSYSTSSIEVVGTFLIQLAFFYIPVVCFSALAVYAPKFAHRHQLQPREGPPTRQDILKCLRIVASNQAMTLVFHVALIGVLPHKPGYRFDETLPPLREVLWNIIACMLIREILFYYAHRLLHNRIFYSRIHKLHHQFTAPFALAAQYAHPIEHMIANVAPISLPPQLLRCHILTFWVFLAIELLETTCVHSGYDFLRRAAETHDLHHEKFTGNFGTIGLLDWAHGTRLK